VPSLDAVDKQLFARLNRPHQDLELEAIVEGLSAFRRDYRGQFHLEILLVTGMNDAQEHLKSLARVAETLCPDRVELNTVVRPPAYSGVGGCNLDQMHAAARLFPQGRTEVIGSFAASAEEEHGQRLPDRITELLRRRPCTSEEMAASLAVSREAVENELHRLEQHGILKASVFDGHRFYRLAERQPS
jgi:wyosine [tRNA(Phe)-imidazoG37] synthetase (radical SAM superfamily)